MATDVIEMMEFSANEAQDSDHEEQPVVSCMSSGLEGDVKDIQLDFPSTRAEQKVRKLAVPVEAEVIVEDVPLLPPEPEVTVHSQTAASRAESMTDGQSKCRHFCILCNSLELFS